MIKQFGVAAIALALTAGASIAATVDAHFDLRIGGNDTNKASFSYYSNGVDLTVSGIRCNDGTGPNSASCTASDIDRSSTYGIYFNQPNDSDHEVDGENSNEFIKLSFAPDVTLKSIRFSYWDSDDNARIYTYGNSSWNEVVNIDGHNLWSSSYEYTFSTYYTGSMFLVGATGDDDEWKLKEVSVRYEPSAVPLPAASWLLLAGIGGLVALRRKKAA